MQQLLEAGADANAGEYPRVLYNAAAMGHDAIVQRLLEAGAHSSTKFNLDAALQAAAQGGYEPVVQRLLEAGAALEATRGGGGGEGGTALQAAAREGHYSVVQRLAQRRRRREPQAGYNDTTALQGRCGRGPRRYRPASDSGGRRRQRSSRRLLEQGGLRRPQPASQSPRARGHCASSSLKRMPRQGGPAAAQSGATADDIRGEDE